MWLILALESGDICPPILRTWTTKGRDARATPNQGLAVAAVGCRLELAVQAQPLPSSVSAADAKKITGTYLLISSTCCCMPDVYMVIVLHR